MKSGFTKTSSLSVKKLSFGIVYLTLLLLSAILIYSYSKRSHTERPVSSNIAESSSPVPTLMLADKFVYRQDDNRWGSETIGNTEDTLSAYGCTISSVALAASNLTQTEITPSMLQTRLREVNGFTSRGLLIWDKVLEATDGKVKAVYYDQPNHADIRACMVAGNYPVIKIKLYDPIIHWVAIVGTKKDQYLIRDPLVGGADDGPILLSERSTDIFGVRCIIGTMRQ